MLLYNNNMLYRICFMFIGVIKPMLNISNHTRFNNGNEITIFLKKSTDWTANTLILLSSFIGVFHHPNYMPLNCALYTFNLGIKFQLMSIIFQLIF
jgi:hypothetical protein